MTTLWAWGVDVGVHAAHFAFEPYMLDRKEQIVTVSVRWSSTEADKAQIRRAIPPCPQHEQRLPLQAGTLERFVAAMVEHYPPYAVGVETPKGMTRHPELEWAYAVTVTSLAFGTLMSPWGLTPQEWKKAAGLPGNADKVRIAHWAAQFGWNPMRDPQDHADARGVARAVKTLWIERGGDA